MSETPRPAADGTPQADLASRPRRSRRRFLKWLGGSAVGLAAASIYPWRIEPHWIDVVRRDLPIAHLPSGLAGRTLALLADLHVGPVVDPDFIRAAMRRVNELRPDAIAIAGDLMSGVGGEQITAAVDMVSRLDRPDLGIFVVLGNHDYGRGWRNPAVAAELAGRLAERGLTVLRNESAVVRGLHVVGLDDLWAYDPRIATQANMPAGGDLDMPAVAAEFRTGPGYFFDPSRVLPSLPSDAPAIALVHNPDAADMPCWSNYHGWILAGHTHGGQVDLPLVGTPILPVRNKAYVEGEIELSWNRQLYINRGLGYLRRVRLFSRPEITLFTLRNAGPP